MASMILPFLLMAATAIYYVTYEVKKTKGRHKEKNYRLYFSLLIIPLAGANIVQMIIQISNN